MPKKSLLEILSEMTALQNQLIETIRDTNGPQQTSLPAARPPQRMKIREAAIYVGLSEAALRQRAEAGTIIGHQTRKGCHWYFYRDELDQWLQSERRKL